MQVLLIYSTVVLFSKSGPSCSDTDAISKCKAAIIGLWVMEPILWCLQLGNGILTTVNKRIMKRLYIQLDLTHLRAHNTGYGSEWPVLFRIDVKQRKLSGSPSRGTKGRLVLKSN